MIYQHFCVVSLTTKRGGADVHSGAHVHMGLRMLLLLYAVLRHIHVYCTSFLHWTGIRNYLVQTMTVSTTQILCQCHLKKNQNKKMETQGFSYFACVIVGCLFYLLSKSIDSLINIVPSLPQQWSVFMSLEHER